mgnify:CR=1 FL=1
MGRKIVDLTGKKFGRLSVICKTNKMSGNHHYYLCVCDCGIKTMVIGSNLVSGGSESCGCLRKEVLLIDLTDKIFGKLKVIEREGKTKNNSPTWICLCECGNTVTVVGSSLKEGLTKSCGCITESWIASETKKYFVKNYRIFNIQESKNWLFITIRYLSSVGEYFY